MRTQDEIVARIKAAEEDDVFGFSREVLLRSLDFEHARPFLNKDATAHDWDKETQGTPNGSIFVGPLLKEEDIRKTANEYLVFAWGKAQDHRGISAERSVMKLTQYLWLLGMDKAIKYIEEAGYAQYGCPKLKVAALALGAPIPTDSDLVRMMEGVPCFDGCDQGCGD